MEISVLFRGQLDNGVVSRIGENELVAGTFFYSNVTGRGETFLKKGLSPHPSKDFSPHPSDATVFYLLTTDNCKLTTSSCLRLFSYQPSRYLPN